MTAIAKAHRVYVGIGSNLMQPHDQIKAALRALSSQAKFSLVKSSRWYQSKAVGPGEQPDYINGAVLIECGLPPEQTLEILQQIESDQGRKRNIRWGARTLDLDILLFDQLSIASERLTIPHPEIANRNFVMQPLLDIDSSLRLPDGRYIADMLLTIGADELREVTI